MPEQVTEEVIKRAITQRMRRYNKTVARRVRLLPEKVFTKLLNHRQAINPAPFESERATMVFKAKQFNDRYTAISRLLSGKSPSSLQHQKELLVQSLAAPQELAKALLSGTEDSADELTIQHFLAAHAVNHSHNELDALPALARKLGAMSQQDDLNSKEARAFARRIEVCLNQAGNAIDAFYIRVRNDSNIAIFSTPGSAIVTMPRDWSSFFTLETLKHMAGLGTDDPLLVLSNQFENGIAENIYRVNSPVDTETSEGLAFNVSSENLTLKGHDDYDSLLNTDIKNNSHHPLKSINEAIAGQTQLSIDSPIEVVIDDLSALNTLNIECRTAHQGLTHNQFDVFLALHKDMSGVFTIDDKRHVLALKDIPDGLNVTWHINDKDSVALDLLSGHIAAIKAADENVTFKINQSAPGQFLCAKLLSNREAKIIKGHDSYLAFPDPGRRQRGQAVKDAATPLRENGYLSREYTAQSWRQALSQVGDPNKLAARGEESLHRILSLTEASTFIDIQFERESDANAVPYRATMSIFSATAKGPNIRSVDLLIRNGQNVSTATLQSMGLSQQEFNALAIEADDAEKTLLKPIKNAEKQGKVLFGVRNSKFSLSAVQSAMPELFKSISGQVLLDPLALTKQHSLSARSDEIMPLYLARNGGKPIYFSDTPGSSLGVRGLLSGATTRILSNDEQYALSMDEDTLYIHDFSAGARFKWGSKQDLSLHLHSNQKKSNVQHVDGSLESLLRDVKVTQLLDQSKPETPISFVDFVSPKGLTPSLSPKAQEIMSVLQDKWVDIQGSFDFSTSLPDNLTRVSPMLNRAGLSLEQTIAGGTGGQKGKRFLKDLYKQSSAYFWATTTGKGINTQALLTQDNPAQPITAKDASLTIADVLRANFTAFQAKNPEYVEHYQLRHHAGSLLSRLEPNTVKPPAKAIEALSKEYGCPASQIKKLYDSAYQDRATLTSAGTFQDFIPRAQLTNIGEHGSPLSAWTFLIKLYDTLPATLAPTLKKHIVEQVSRIGMLPLRRHVPSDTYVLSTPFTTDRQLNCHIEGMGDATPTDPFTNDIESLATIMHLQNGTAQITELNASEAALAEAETLFLKTLRSPQNEATLNRLNSFMEKHDLRATFSPNDAVMQRYGESVFLAAIGLGKQPVFNRHFSGKELDAVKREAKALIATLDEHGLIDTPSQSNHQVDILIEQASLQFDITRILNTLLKGKVRPLLMDDNTTLKWKHADRLNNLGIPFEKTTTNEVVSKLIYALSAKLSTKTLADLSHFVNQNEIPEQGTEAKRIYQEVLNTFRTPPNLIIKEGRVRALADSFDIKNISPIDSLMDSSEHINILQQPNLSYSLSPGDEDYHLGIKKNN